MKLTKILGIGLLALVSLTGCMKRYNINHEIVAFNQYLTEPLVAYRDSAKINYCAPWTEIGGEELSGKDIIEIKEYKAKAPLFKRRTPKYKHFPEKHSINNPKDIELINRERRNFDYYLNAIKSIEKDKKRKK